MIRSAFLLAVSSVMMAGPALSADLFPSFSSKQVNSASDSGYYVSGKLIYALRGLGNMDTSLRPGIGSFVAGDDKDSMFGGSVAGGYQHGKWRYELEYTFKQKSEFTSGSSAFPSSFNHNFVDSRRVMANLYRDVALTDWLALNVNFGLGLSFIESYGWQGNESRQYNSNRQTNLTYAVGAGGSFRMTDNLFLDAGYRFVDMGKIESGFNRFSNSRGLVDEQMRGRLTSNEFFVGARYRF